MKTWTEMVATLPRRSFFTLVFLALFLTIIMQLVGAPLTTAAAPAGIVSYEFAGNLAGAERIIASWNEQDRLRAAFSLGIDYLYLVVYALAIGTACLKVAAAWQAKRPGLARLGHWLGWGQMVAALLDAVENLALVQLLLGSTAPIWPSLAWICAALKFTLVLGGLAYALLGFLLYLPYRRAGVDGGTAGI
jgi:hypothetical protein